MLCGSAGNPMTLIKVPEAAQYLQFHVTTIYRMIKRGELPYTKVGGGFRIHKETLEEIFTPKEVSNER